MPDGVQEGDMGQSTDYMTFSPGPAQPSHPEPLL